MSDRMSKLWSEIKNQGENIGLFFLILGIGVLLVLFVLVIVGIETELWLLGTSLGLLSVGLGFIAVGMAKKGDTWAHARLAYLLGTVEEEKYAELDLARSPQSKSYQLTGNGKEDLIYYSGTPKHVFYFGNAWIRLDSMREGDIVRIRLYIIEDGEESQVSDDDNNTYTGVQHVMVKINGGFYNKEGVKITAEQIGVSSSPIKIGCYVYDAMRGG